MECKICGQGVWQKQYCQKCEDKVWSDAMKTEKLEPDQNKNELIRFKLQGRKDRLQNVAMRFKNGEISGRKYFSVSSVLTGDELELIRNAPRTKFTGVLVPNSGGLWCYIDENNNLYLGSGSGASGDNEGLSGFEN